jgi:RNA-binding protein Luc7-like 2
MDEGPCDKVHSEVIKTAFQKSGDTHMHDNFIEKEFLARIAEADRIIKRARARVEDDKAEDEELDLERNPDLLRVHGEISKVVQLAETFAEDDDIDNCFQLMTKYDDLFKEKNGFVNKINDLKRHRFGAPDKKLRVCDVCGSFLSLFDSDKRLQDHFLGKQHIGYQVNSYSVFVFFFLF